MAFGFSDVLLYDCIFGNVCKIDSCQLMRFGQNNIVNSVRVIAKSRIEKRQNKGKITLMPRLNRRDSAINPNMKVNRMLYGKFA